MKKTFLALVAAVLPAWALVSRTQAAVLPLAITEVMAQSNPDLLPGFRGPDFWELTNFGTNTLDLSGFSFSDNNTSAKFPMPFNGLEIRAGESILFCRSNKPPVDSRDAFLAWWGTANLPPGLPVRFFAYPGLDGEVEDQVWLFDEADNVVDMVSFSRSTIGRSFTYDAEAGAFGTPSVPGVCGAWRAALNPNDIGSPGLTCGPVPLSIVQQPASQTVDGCGVVTFIVITRGVPRPHYQWYHDGNEIMGATEPTLTLAEAQPAAAGAYRVHLDNGLTNLNSSVAVLTVSTKPVAPSILRGPVDISVFPGQIAVFSVQARGFPCLDYQWFVHDAELA